MTMVEALGIMDDGGGMGGNIGASVGVGDQGSSGGDGGGSVHGEAGNDHRVGFLGPETVGWDLAEERFLGGFPWDYASCWGRIRHIPVAYGFHGVSSPSTVGPQQGTKGRPLTPSSLHSFIEDNEIGSISKNALRGLRSLTHLCVPPSPQPSLTGTPHPSPRHTAYPGSC